MDRYLPPECTYEIIGDTIVTDGTIERKLTGTMLGGVLGISPWSSAFTVSCSILGLGEKDVGDKPAVKVGQALEGKIIKYLGEKYSEIGQFIPAEEIFEARTGPHHLWPSDFDDPDFAGHLDGVVIDDEGNDYVLEIKTSTNLAAWLRGVPLYYFYQVALYNHFVCKKDKAYVALGIPAYDTYRDPTTWVPDSDNVLLFEVTIDQEEIAQTVEEMRHWRAKVLADHTTAPFDLSSRVDAPMAKHLMAITSGEDAIVDILEEYLEVSEMIQEREDAMYDLTTRKEELKEQLKDYMDTNQVDSIEARSAPVRATLLKKATRKVSATKLKEAGIDPEPYTEVTVSNTFRITKIME